MVMTVADGGNETVPKNSDSLTILDLLSMGCVTGLMITK